MALSNLFTSYIQRKKQLGRMRLSFSESSPLMSLSPDDADSASPTVAASARISFRFLSPAVMIRLWTFGYVLFIYRAVYESVSTIFSCSNPRPPFCRETSRTSTSTRFAFSRQDNPPKHSTMALRRTLRFPLATKETSDWREAKKARPSTF